MTNSSLPRDWQEADQLDGYDLVNKGELIERPFRCLSATFHTNDNGVHFVTVEAEYTDRKLFAFNDSSTGVRAQLVDYLTTRLKEVPADGVVYPLDLVAPRGMRISEYGITRDNQPVPLNSPLTVRKAVTYYLTTSGKPHRETAPETAPALKAGKTKVATKRTAVRRSEPAVAPVEPTSDNG